MNPASILAAIPGISVLVVGDICLDRWCRYDPSEADISRETAIPRIAVVSTEVTPGAGGTVANNLVALGAKRVAVVGAIGDDGFGFELQHALRARGIAGGQLVIVPGMQTFTYTKLINDATKQEDRPRVDFITMRPLTKTAETQILDRLQTGIAAHDLILISDQAETSRGGNITEAVRDLLAALAPAYPDKWILVDS
ncbi:MAG: ribokinase, partial [Bryobacteraceae bacterium]